MRLNGYQVVCEALSKKIQVLPDDKGRVKGTKYYKNGEFMYNVVLNMGRLPKIGPQGDMIDVWVGDTFNDFVKQLDEIQMYDGGTDFRNIKEIKDHPEYGDCWVVAHAKGDHKWCFLSENVEWIKETPKIMRLHSDYNKIGITEFDKYFYNRQISKQDQEKSGLNSSVYKYTITKNIGEVEAVLAIVGFVGFIPTKLDPKVGFVQILILPKYRGQGILEIAEDQLAELHQLKSLWATIDKDNISSIKSHLKAGFKYFPKSKINEWIKMGKLNKNQIRLYKNYK
jgi:RimJ/RimL family protein N-acetyltransferase